MKTATEMRMESIEAAREANHLDVLMSDFIRRYAPPDGYCNLQFHSHLHAIVRATYATAQAPFVKQLSVQFASMPSPAFRAGEGGAHAPDEGQPAQKEKQR